MNRIVGLRVNLDDPATDAVVTWAFMNEIKIVDSEVNASLVLNELSDQNSECLKTKHMLNGGAPIMVIENQKCVDFVVDWIDSLEDDEIVLEVSGTMNPDDIQYVLEELLTSD